MRLLLSKCNICLLSFGAVLVFLGLIFISIFSVIHEAIISDALKFEPDSKAFLAWQKPKSAIGMKIYFFNWTNHEDFKKHNVKPKFVEVGPYAFKQMKEKKDITWNDGNKTITYKYLKKFYFDEENSVGPLTDEIISINMVALTAAHTTNDWFFALRFSIGLQISVAQLHTKKSVRELLFDGYSDPIIDSARAFSIFSNDKPDKFGWFYGRNNTIGSDGIFSMGTSADENFGKLKQWNFSNHTGFYENYCGALNGSGGELFTRNQNPDKIVLFTPEMCRSLQFNFEEYVTIKGIPCYKYSPGDEVFDNGTKIPSNKCFCNERCLPYGVLNTSSCRDNAPVFLSLPHFYKGDSSFVEAVEGLSPDANKHELYITLEPRTGVIADIAARMQVNVLVEPKASYTLYENVPKVLFPVLWFEQTVLMSDELASGLTLLFSLPKINRFICIFLMIVGLLFILSVILYVTCYKQRRSSKPKITKEEIPLKSKS